MTLDSALVGNVTREVLEGFLALPKRGLEVGGILLGRAGGDRRSSVHVDGFEPVPCEHRFGPSYIFSDTDRERLARILAGIREQGTRIVGWYRSYTGRDMALDDHDRELIRDHFGDDELVYLLVRPVAFRQCVVDVAFLTKDGREAHAEPALVVAGENGDSKVEEYRAKAAAEDPVDMIAPPAAPAPEEPVTPFRDSEAVEVTPVREEQGQAETADGVVSPRRSSKLMWAAVCVAMGASGYSAYQTWRVSEQVNSVQSSVRALVEAREAAVAIPVPAAAPAAETASPHAITNPREVDVAVPAQAVSEVQPRVPDGVRVRISGRMEVPIKVDIDKSGRVIRAVPQGEGDSLYHYVGGAAAKAARKWRFRPAKSSEGMAMASSKTLVFVVEGSAKAAASLP